MNVVHCKFWLHVSPTAGEGSKRKTRVTHGHKSCCKSSAAHSGNSGLLHCIEQVINAVLTCSAVWGLGLQLSEFGGILHLRPPLLANGAFELICLNTSWYFMVEGAKASLQESNHAKWLLQSTDAMHWMRHTHSAFFFQHIMVTQFIHWQGKANSACIRLSSTCSDCVRRPSVQLTTGQQQAAASIHRFCGVAFRYFRHSTNEQFWHHERIKHHRQRHPEFFV